MDVAEGEGEGVRCWGLVVGLSMEIDGLGWGGWAV